jgi:hypothetical protein
MAHFAELDNDDIVLRVVVISNDDLLDENGDEQESIGVSVCKNIFGESTKWVQTSYNNKFRKQYAGIGMKFDVSADLFYDPNPPYPSWVLSADFDWLPPVARPENEVEGRFWAWNEEDGNWESIALPTPPESE